MKNLGFEHTEVDDQICNIRAFEYLGEINIHEILNPEAVGSISFEYDDLYFYAVFIHHIGKKNIRKDLETDSVIFHFSKLFDVSPNKVYSAITKIGKYLREIYNTQTKAV